MPPLRRLRLRRELNESIVCILPDGQHFLIHVDLIRGRKGVTLAFDAPEGIAIVRRELLAELAQEQAEARGVEPEQDVDEQVFAVQRAARGALLV
jgi:sRNA-binding carbon storage regulator CsrA